VATSVTSYTDSALSSVTDSNSLLRLDPNPTEKGSGSFAPSLKVKNGPTAQTETIVYIKAQASTVPTV
jgi:hypothetical protein